jgi:hypothetical protein
MNDKIVVSGKRHRSGKIPADRHPARIGRTITIIAVKRDVTDP